MTEHDAFLANIRENPDDDGPRLMYADWLTERGDPRGEFIRVQCELARLDADDLRRPALIKRANGLVRRYGPGWREAMPRIRGVRWGAFERGFVGSVSVSSVGGLLDALDSLVEAAPAVTIKLSGSHSPNLERLFASPRASRIRALEIDSYDLTTQAVQALAASPHATGLRSLALNSLSLGPEAVVALAGSPHLSGLRRLAIWESGIEDAGAIALAESVRLSSLTSLSLIDTMIGHAGVRALAASSQLRLAELALTGNTLSARTLQALANNPRMGGLTHLTLQGYCGPSQGFETLLTSPHLLRLAHLDLSLHGVTTLRPRVLGAASPGTALRRLHLDSGRLDADAARALAGCPRLAGLRTLSLDHNGFGDEAVAALAASPFLTGLQLLSLQLNRIGNEGARALAGAWKQLEVVDLRHNRIGLAGVKALLTSPVGKHTSSLQLDYNKDGPEGQKLRRRRRVRAWPGVEEAT